MNSKYINRRRFVSGFSAILGSLGLPACGGGGGGGDTATTGQASAAAPAPAPAPAPTPAPAPSPPPAPTAGTAISTLKLHSSVAGTQPYTAAVLLLQGQAPSGFTLASPDDGALRASVLSRWQDGSAAVMVVAGRATVAAAEDRTLRLQLASETNGETALGAARVSQLVTSVVLNFGALGSADLRDFSAPERIWWANSQTVCARYRVRVSGHAGLEAVIDIHAYLDARALVEVVVENGRLNLPASSSPPPAASYAAATVSVNGNLVATVNGNATPEGAHSQSRAWYAAAWVGGDPGLRATQAAADLQTHPLLFKIGQASNADMAQYAGDTYTPWGTGRHRASSMGGAGDHESIGPLPQWEARFLQTGDYRAARAVEASALAILGYNVNYRDQTTGLVPTLDQLAGKNIQNGSWPTLYGAGDAMSWEQAHHPAVGLMAFVCRPSPVFIELAQKVAVWNATWSTDGGTETGVFGYWYQIRGRAWCLRSLAHATFLTPDALPWKAAGLSSITKNVSFLSGWTTDSKALLNTMWDYIPNSVWDHQGYVGLQSPIWEYHYLITELHKLASANLLPMSSQTALNSVADWCALQPVRWVNEQTNGAWRYISYDTTLGRSPSTVDSLPTWGAQRTFRMTDAPPAAAGPLYSHGAEPTLYSDFVQDNNAGAYYPSYWWAALVAARERSVPGAAQAWQTVQAQVTNLSAWLGGFGADPRWGSTPRNL